VLVMYFACLIVGGVLVGLAAFAGAGDPDVDAHHDFDGHHHLDGDIDGDFDGDFDGDLDGDLDAELDGDLDGAHFDAHAGHDLGHDAHHPSASDAAHGVKDADARKKLWLPFSSMRFWTFGTAAFGLTGVLLTAVGAFSPALVLFASLATGAGVGTAVAYAMHHLRRAVNADAVERSDYPGQVGELLMPLRPGTTSRVRLQIRHREVIVLARTTESLDLPRGARVVVLALDEDGHALVAPEDRLFAHDP
jgi:hypothetical protein